VWFGDGRAHAESPREKDLPSSPSHSQRWHDCQRDAPECQIIRMASSSVLKAICRNRVLRVPLFQSRPWGARMKRVESVASRRRTVWMTGLPVICGGALHCAT